MRAPFLPKNKKDVTKQVVIQSESLRDLHNAVEEFEHDILSLKYYVDGTYFKACIKYK